MSKTPEEMAEEYADLCVSDAYYAPLKAGFLAGYQAAMEQNEDYKAKADKWGQELCELNLKYAAKCEAYAEKCAEDEGRDATDQVADASKVINSSNNSNGWISVKDRLPEDGQEVLVFEEGTISTNCFSNRREPFLRWDLYPSGFSCHPSHWMPLPESPKEEITSLDQMHWPQKRMTVEELREMFPCKPPKEEK